MTLEATDRTDAVNDSITPAATEPLVSVLRAAGVGVVVALPEHGLPEVVHWGRDIGPLDAAGARHLLRMVARPPSPSALDETWPLTLLPGEHDGWEGRPGLAGHVGRRAVLPRWHRTAVNSDERHLRVEAQAEGLSLVIELTLDTSGVLKVEHELYNTSGEPVDLAILEATMPVGDLATEVLDFSGRWTRERAPQRRPLTQGSHARESRRGRTGHDSPLVLAAGTEGFSATRGELWAVHLAWSGDSVYRIDALPESRTVLGAGALKRPGEITVEPGGSFRTPAAMFVWSDEGHLLAAISALVTEYRLDYIKWDQNRDLIEAVSAGRANVHRHTEAVYRLLATLKARHPGLEIESCASGGARMDLGILEHTDRVWASDTNDPVERLAIQRWTELLLPPELIGTHVGPPVSHTTKRATGLGFRIAVAMFGHFGIEWDITTCTPEELHQLRGGIATYKQLRPLLHSGDVHHPPTGDAGTSATVVIARDGSNAVVGLARSDSAARALPALLRIPGLAADQRYRVTVPSIAALPRGVPPLLAVGDGPVETTGSALEAVGLRPPLLHPAHSLVIVLDGLGLDEM